MKWWKRETGLKRRTTEARTIELEERKMSKLERRKLQEQR
jgi:hypothetical protein